MSAEPLVSVIVPIRRAQSTVRNTITSLLEQCRTVPAEIVAVVSEKDPSRKALEGLKAPALRVIVAPGRHGVPQLRRDGVWQSRGAWVVITEDHCVFPSGWLEGLVEDLPAGSAHIRGGPVVNGRTSLIGWAQYFTRYSSFMPPVAGGTTRTLPGNNACYPRALLARNSELLRDGFWEAEFNQSVAERQCTLSISPELGVEQRQQRGVFEYMFLRYRHGRCYGGRRFEFAPKAERRRLLWNIPLIPVVLFWRSARAVFRKGHNRSKFLLTSPLLAAYFLAWAIGEATGYVFGSGASCLDTD